MCEFLLAMFSINGDSLVWQSCCLSSGMQDNLSLAVNPTGYYLCYTHNSTIQYNHFISCILTCISFRYCPEKFRAVLHVLKLNLLTHKFLLWVLTKKQKTDSSLNLIVNMCEIGTLVNLHKTENS